MADTNNATTDTNVMESNVIDSNNVVEEEKSSDNVNSVDESNVTMETKPVIISEAESTTSNVTTESEPESNVTKESETVNNVTSEELTISSSSSSITTTTNSVVVEPTKNNDDDDDVAITENNNNPEESDISSPTSPPPVVVVDDNVTMETTMTTNNDDDKNDDNEDIVVDKSEIVETDDDKPQLQTEDLHESIESKEITEPEPEEPMEEDDANVDDGKKSPSVEIDLEDGELPDSDEDEEPTSTPTSNLVKLVIKDPPPLPTLLVDSKKVPSRKKSKDTLDVKSKEKDKSDKKKKDKEKEKREKKDKKRRHSEEEKGSISKSSKRKKDDDILSNVEESEFLYVRGASPVPGQGNGSPFGNEMYGREFDEDEFGGRRGTPREHRHRRGERPSEEERPPPARPNRRKEEVIARPPKSDQICSYFMQGKCQKSSDDCSFSHDAVPPRKMELCKFWMMECCAKKEKCLYLHNDFPCKFYHTGLVCKLNDKCKFSHQPLNEQTKAVLLKHIETAPKEILGDFPRLNRNGALNLINKMEARINGMLDPKPDHMDMMDMDRNGNQGGNNQGGGPPRRTRWEQPTKDDQDKLHELMEEAGIGNYYDQAIQQDSASSSSGPLLQNHHQQQHQHQNQNNHMSHGPPPGRMLDGMGGGGHPPPMNSPMNHQGPPPILPSSQLPLHLVKNPALANVLANLNIPSSTLSGHYNNPSQLLQNLDLPGMLPGLYPPNATPQQIQQATQALSQQLQSLNSLHGGLLQGLPPGLMGHNPPNMNQNVITTASSPQTINQSSTEINTTSSIPSEEEQKSPPPSSSTTTTTTAGASSSTPSIEHLPKMQQELFMRVQSMQKKKEEELKDDGHPPLDDDWYSSDEEKEVVKKKPETKPDFSSVLSAIRETVTNTTNKLNTPSPSLNSGNSSVSAGTSSDTTASTSKDVDFRSTPFGDTDFRLPPLRMEGFQDIDLRSKDGPPNSGFKKMPDSVATEIPAGISSHPPINWRVWKVAGVKKIDYSHVRHTVENSQLDPRLSSKGLGGSTGGDGIGSNLSGPASPPPVALTTGSPSRIPTGSDYVSDPRDPRGRKSNRDSGRHQDSDVPHPSMHQQQQQHMQHHQQKQQQPFYPQPNDLPPAFAQFMQMTAAAGNPTAAAAAAFLPNPFVTLPPDFMNIAAVMHQQQQQQSSRPPLRHQHPGHGHGPGGFHGPPSGNAWDIYKGPGSTPPL